MYRFLFFNFGVDFDLFTSFCDIFWISCYEDDLVSISASLLLLFPFRDCNCFTSTCPNILCEDGLFGSRTISIAQLS